MGVYGVLWGPVGGFGVSLGSVGGSKRAMVGPMVPVGQSMGHCEVTVGLVGSVGPMGGFVGGV